MIQDTFNAQSLTSNLAMIETKTTTTESGNMTSQACPKLQYIRWDALAGRISLKRKLLRGGSKGRSRNPAEFCCELDDEAPSKMIQS